MLYEARTKLYDSLNGISLYRGEVVSTEDDKWVKRFGNDSLKPVSVAPEGQAVIVIKDTREGKSEPAVTSKAKAPLKPIRAKIMDVDNGAQKFKG